MDASVRALAWLLPLVLGCSSAAPLPPKAIALNRDGAPALASGDLVTAEARLAVAVEYNPRFVEAWVNLGLVELRRGNLVLARAHLTHARTLNPDLPTPHHGLGLLAEREGHAAEAEDHYRDALAVDPGFGAARANLGRKLFERGAIEDARKQFLRLTEVCPEMVDGWREGSPKPSEGARRARKGDGTLVMSECRPQLRSRWNGGPLWPTLVLRPSERWNGRIEPA